MDLNEREKAKLRTQLASRKSFFGCTLNTCKDAAAPNYYHERKEFLIETNKKGFRAKKDSRDDKVAAADKVDNFGTTPSKSVQTPKVDYTAFSNLINDSTSFNEAERLLKSHKLAIDKNDIKQRNDSYKTSHRADRDDSKAVTKCKLVNEARNSTPQSKTNSKVVDSNSSRELVHTARLVRDSPPRRLNTVVTTSRMSLPIPSKMSLLKSAPVKKLRGKKKRDKLELGRMMAIAPQTVSGPTRSQRANAAMTEEVCRLKAELGLSSVPCIKSGQKFMKASSGPKLPSKNSSGADWRQELQNITGYNPRSYTDEIADDEKMETTWKSIQCEEAVSLRIGRKEDRLAEEEEIKHKRQKLMGLKGKN